MEIKYVIELKKGNRTSYSKSKLYLKSPVRDYFHIVTDIDEATKYKKQHLAKIYKKFGRNRIIKKLVRI